MEFQPFEPSPRLVDLFSREPTGHAFDGEHCALAGRADRGVHVQHTIHVVREAHVDLLRTRRPSWDTSELVLTELLVLSTERVLALVHFEQEPRLVLCERGEALDTTYREHGSAFDDWRKKALHQRRSSMAARSHTEREWRNVRHDQIAHRAVALLQRHLDRSAHGNGLVRWQNPERQARKKLARQAHDAGHARRATDQ